MGRKTTRPDLLQVLTQLPLFDDLYLGMQAQNIAIVDLHIEDLEANLLAAYHASDSTPIPEMMLVSALSQMWVFAVYELLRTWRQRITELLTLGSQLQHLRGADRAERIKTEQAAIQSTLRDTAAAAMRRSAIKWALTKAKRNRLQRAFDRVTPLYRRLEALRIALAKHEVARTGKRGKTPALVARDPGYARIDLDGSIKWLFDYAGGKSDMLSRHGLADELRRLHRGRSTVGPAASTRTASLRIFLGECSA